MRTVARDPQRTVAWLNLSEVYRALEQPTLARLCEEQYAQGRSRAKAPPSGSVAPPARP